MPGSLLRLFRRRFTSEQRGTLEKQLNSFDDVLASLCLRYTDGDGEEQLKEQWAPFYKEILSLKLQKKDPLRVRVSGFRQKYESLHACVEDQNRNFMRRETSRVDTLLSDIDGKSLDAQQRTVVVCDESRNLVLAGAGSGKTLTIAGKVKYLCSEKGISPEDILLIAFTKKSAEEMTERISGRLGIPVTATTFHKLGLDIITASRNKRPDVVDDLTEFVQDYFEKQIVDSPEAVRNLIEYFAYYLRLPADMDRFDSLGAAYEYEKGAELETIRSKYDATRFLTAEDGSRRAEKRTLKNERVKSLEEVSIANFLFLNGINYEYERKYPFESDDPTRKTYCPDFYLPDYDIYIEHFGIARDGSLPWLSEIEEKKYQEDMKWKRAFHRKNGTHLLETYSYYSSEGRLLEELERMLRVNGVRFETPDFRAIFNVVYSSESDRYFSEFIGLCCTFISLFKSNGYGLNDLDGLYSSNPDYDKPFFRKRNALFKSIIRPVIASYGRYLEEAGAVDFSDMINAAAETVRSGFAVRRYRWVIIDEYQDISVARYRLVKAILDRTGAKLLCVGDDWQSIYRFAGSDIRLFTDFGGYFGKTAVMRIEQTYRNSQQLIDVAGEFVMRNPAQLRKNLRSHTRLDYPVTFMCYRRDPFTVLRRTMEKIISDSGPEASILILGRTNYDSKMLVQSGMFSVKANGNVTYAPSPETPVSFMSVHKAKGLEADNVVLLNFRNSTLGFPNKIADDPVLEMVLTAGDGYPYAEERRLLYVALTRTRRRVFILTDENSPSEFLKEFETSGSVFVLHSEQSGDAKRIMCPRCRTGQLTVRKREEDGSFFVGCSNYPGCDYTVRDTSVMTDTRYCPECGGFMVRKKGRFGSFYGCTNYPSCTHTEEIKRK